MSIIWKIIGWVKSYWWVILIGLFLGALGFANYYKLRANQEEDRANRWKSNHDQLRTDYKQTQDKLGRKETKVKNYRVTIEELQSDLYEKNGTLEELKRELEYSNVKIANLKEALVAEIESANEGDTIIYDTTIKKKEYRYLHVNDDYLDFQANWKQTDSVNWTYQYSEKIFYWTEFKRDIYNDEGNKRFFLWRVWPFKYLLPKKPETKVKSTNPNSVIRAKKYEIAK